MCDISHRLLVGHSLSQSCQIEGDSSSLQLQIRRNKMQLPRLRVFIKRNEHFQFQLKLAEAFWFYGRKTGKHLFCSLLYSRSVPGKQQFLFFQFKCAIRKTRVLRSLGIGAHVLKATVSLMTLAWSLSAGYQGWISCVEQLHWGTEPAGLGVRRFHQNYDYFFKACFPHSIITDCRGLGWLSGWQSW